jgi:lipopolysaccharide export system permease protein
MREFLKTIDWYIIKKFLSSFFFTVLIFVLIAVVIDFSEKVEKFIEEPITKKEILLEYYPSFIIWIAGQLWSVCTLQWFFLLPGWPTIPKSSPFSMRG